MKVRVLFFARYGELVGQDEREVTIPGTATVGDLLSQLRSSLPGAEKFPVRPMVAVNQAHSGLEASLSEGDEIALLPPLAGG